MANLAHAQYKVLVVRSLERLFGYDRDQAEEHFELCNEESGQRSALFESIRSTLNPKRTGYEHVIGRLERVVGSYEEILAKLRTSRFIPLFRGNYFPDIINPANLRQVISAAASKEGIIPGRGLERLVLTGLDHTIDSLSDVLKINLVDGRMQLIHTLSENLSRINQIGYGRVYSFANDLRDDLMKIVSQIPELPKDEIGIVVTLVMNPHLCRGTLEGLAEVYLSFQDETEFGLYKSISYTREWRVLDAQQFRTNLASVKGTGVDLATVSEIVKGIPKDKRAGFFQFVPGNLHAIRIYEAIREGYTSRKRAQLPGRFLAALENTEISTDLGLVEELVAATQPNNRLKLFEILGPKPKSVSLYEKLKSQQITPAEFSDFTLNYNSRRFGSDTSLLVTLADIIDNGKISQLRAAVYILKNAEFFAKDQNADTIKAISAYHFYACEILQGYQNAQSKRDNNRATLFLKLGLYFPAAEDSDDFIQRHLKVERIHDSRLSWAYDIQSREDLEARLSSLDPDTDSSLERREGSRSIQYNEMLKRLKPRDGFGDREKSKLGQANKKLMELRPPQDKRLIDVYETYKEDKNLLKQRLLDFAQDVLELSSNPGYQLILREDGLFGQYLLKPLIGDLAFRQGLIDLKGSEIDIRKGVELLLNPSKRVEREATQVILDINEAPRSIYDRIIIYGGYRLNRLMPQVRSHFREFEVEFYDINKTVAPITYKPSDLIIYAREDMSHSKGLKVLESIRSQDFEPNFFDGRGASSLIRFINERLYK